MRALEGELARTIRLMRGVKVARVHIVMADEVNMVPGGFGAWTTNARAFRNEPVP